MAAPAAPALLKAQQPAGAGPAAGGADPAPLQFAVPDVAADTVRRFFDDRQFATLRRLSEIFEPPVNGAGAIETRAPEFLDFLLSESPRDRRQLYLSGLEALEYEAQTSFGRPFAEADDAQVAQLLAPLRQPWTYEAPSPLAAFLREVKEDVRTAARNSKEWADAGRPGAGGGQYWLPVE